MTEAEGVEKGGAVSGRMVVIEMDSRRPVVATGLRLSCDTTATVPAHSLPLYLVCCSLQSAVCGLRSAFCVLQQASRERADGRAPAQHARDRQARPGAE